LKKIIIISCASRDFLLFRLGLLKELKARGFNIIISAPHDNYSDKLIKLGYNFLNLQINRKGLNPIEDLILFIKILKILLKEKPNIIINFSIKPIIYGSFASYFFKNLKLINVLTGLGYVFIKNNLLTTIVKILYKIALLRADKIIFQNRDDFEYFKKNKLVSSKKSEVILSSGVDTEYFKPLKLKKTSKNFIFLFMGRILWDKGIKEFIESAKIVREKYRNTKFQILGWFDKSNPSEVSKEYIEELCKKGIIEYLGNFDDVRPFIAQSDVVVLPSYREGVPKVLLEAASMEKPIITTDAPGCREVVKHKLNGLLVPIKDVKSLSEAMLWMIEHPKDRKKMGREGRKIIIKIFDERMVVNKYMKIIFELV